ncbi:rCG38049 [Rattus norvegicus]|uniref:RCG38049 n=1 Tax=Rattus norvegicus TaxID=10116 RepID=A6IV94_RAT|nr:rCG38049 [Rattus norvegicus]
MIVSVNPNFEYRRTQNISDEFIYFRPINAENQERARKQKQQNPSLASQQPTPEGIHQRDLGLMNQVVTVTTPPPAKELESAALVKPKTSGLLRLEKIPVKSTWVLEFQRLDVTGIASPEERGKGTAILVAGVPGKEELDDTEIPTLHFTGFVHLEVLINKCSPSSEYSRPGTPGNLWMESPENAESPGSDDMEVARSMYPFRERSIFRRSWAELLEAPLNSEGLHILQTVHNEENTDMGWNKLTPQEESQGIPYPKDQHFQALQGPFPLLPERPKLQRQRSRSLPRYSEVRGQYLNTPEFKANAEETLFFTGDRSLLTEENIKKRYNMEGDWQRAIPSHSGEQLPIMPRFDNSAIQGNFGIPEDNSARPRGDIRIPQSNVNTIPMVNVGVPVDNPPVLGGNTEVPRGSGFRVYVGSSGRASRPMVSSPLTELSKIGEHQL